MTRICVFGAGAVGSCVAAHLMRANVGEVSIVARGEHLRAIERDGLRYIGADGEWVGRPHAATDDPAALGPQDVVFVTLKTMSQSPSAAAIARLIAPGGHAVFASNGIAWWWKHGLRDAGPLDLVDPGGALWREVGPDRVLGCAVYSANELAAPGVVRHRGNNRWLLGEPSGPQARGSASARLAFTVDLMQRAGLGAQACADIRLELWAKLLRNVSTNPICALTRLSIDGLAQDDGLLAMADRAIDEVVAIAAAHGSDIAAQAVETRESIRFGGGAPGRPLQGVKPSMLQDALAGRSMEVEAILGQVQLLARETGTPCPTVDLLVPLLRGLNLGMR